MLLVWFQDNARHRSDLCVINGNRFDHRPRALLRYFQNVRIDDRDAVLSWEPEKSALVDCTAGPKPAVAFDVQHAVCLALADRLDARLFSIRKSI
jgi:hypothetical protein